MIKYTEKRLFVLGFMVFLALGMCRFGLADEAEPFSIRVLDSPDAVLFGMPVIYQIEIANLTDRTQLLPRYSAMVRTEILQAPAEADQWLRHDKHLTEESRFRYSEDDNPLPSHETLVIQRGFLPPVVGAYTLRVVLHIHETSPRAALAGESLDHWVGEIPSESIDIVVKEPSGIDAEAFNTVCALKPEYWPEPISPAGCYRTSWFPKHPTGARRLLLTKYLDSTYAAYEIFKQYGKRWRGDAGYYQRWATQENLNRIRDYGWCDASGNPNPGEKYTEKLVGTDFLRCRVQWLDIALENHPDTWFSDDIRLTLAGDAYLLGDKERCRSLLEEVITNGRPYAAGKARELLRDMQTKNMLPGSPEDPTEAPVPAAPEGTAAR